MMIRCRFFQKLQFQNFRQFRRVGINTSCPPARSSCVRRNCVVSLHPPEGACRYVSCRVLCASASYCVLRLRSLGVLLRVPACHVVTDLICVWLMVVVLRFLSFFPVVVKMMSSAARVAGRVAARAPTQVKARTMATAKNADPLLKAEGWTVKFAQKPTAPATGHAIWDPASKSHAYSTSRARVVL